MLDSRTDVGCEQPCIMKRIFHLLLLLLLGFTAAIFLLAAPVNAHPLVQNETPYDFPTLDITVEYPEGTFVPYEEPQQPSLTPLGNPGNSPVPGISPTPGTPGAIAAPTEAGTLTASPTTGRNLFGTEDAEMGSARVTPPASETPSPSQTPVELPSVTATPVEGETFNLNRGWFTAGILLPPLLLVGAWLINRARRSGEFG
jgi:hypothetical protein